MRFLAFAFALLIPSLASANDWDMGTLKKEVDSLKSRMSAVEAKLGLSAACPCPSGGKCICPPNSCLCPNCPEHGHGKAATATGVKLLGFTTSSCVHCPGAKSDCEGLAIEWIDADTDPRAKEYNVGPVPALVRIEGGKKTGHFEGRIGLADAARKWLGMEAITQAAKPIAKVQTSPKVIVRSSPLPSPIVKVVRSAPAVRYSAPARPTLSLSRLPGPSWNNPGDLRSHLIHQHGYSPSVINGLSYNQLNVLKDNDHNSWGHGGHPYAGRSRSVSYARPSYQPRVMFSSGCPGGMCPR